MKLKKTFCAIICLIANLTIGFAQVPAFPGAEGFGAAAKGGRGGQVIYVTNLNDSGPGSFRAACEASGPRTVLFKLGGTITLESTVKIEEPYITIAGQSAPGGGICLRTTNDETPLSMKTHDIVMRHIRIRPGSGVTPEGSDTKDALVIKSEDAHDIMIDHCSFTWGVDETVSTYSSDPEDVKNITFQWSIIADALDCNTHIEGCHSKGLLLQYADRVSMHHNLFANNGARNPMLLSGEMDMVNNVTYNWGGSVVKIEARYGPVYLNYVKNYLVPGPDSDLTENGIQVKDTDINLYLEDNIAEHVRPDNSYPEDAIVNYREAGTEVDQRFNYPRITATSAEQAYNEVLDGVGATLPSLDRVDTDIINGVRNRTGRIIDYPSDVGGYPNLALGNAPTDSDSDGIPDQWEASNGLNPNNANDGSSDKDGDGYTNLEEYLNSLTNSNTTVPEDCNGDQGGSAYIDSCGNCVGGNTNDDPCNPNTGDTEITVSVIAKKDDAEEDPNGKVDLNSSDIELVEDKTITQTVGLRFRNISVPKNAKITKAYIQFTVDEPNSNPCNLIIKGHDTNDAALFDSLSNYNISNRPTTDASVNWNPNPWTSIGETGLNQRTPDIKTIIQEIVNRDGWASNNSIAIIIEGSGERTAKSYDGSPDQAATLKIEYETVDTNISFDIQNYNPPTNVTPGESYTIEIPYTGVGAANMKISLQNKDDNWVTEGAANVSINGNGTATLKVTVDSDAKPGNNYTWQAYITPAGGNWNTRYVNKQIDGISCNQTNRSSNLSKDISQVSFYPNPANDKLVLRVNSSLQEIQSIIIYDLQGRITKEISKNELKENVEQSIDISSIKDGIYILSIDFNKKETQNSQFIIKH
ncbi:T9SS type A sorting domain-containing protein [uncultured Aquimarina sp.]|uniref:T9SS type A sorting domain-containing protein n=1 Tax=uncultured Aquimarina sp. TaxID=575652 RepID=UPI00260D0715|nr:T9SS type A sorting domain-containing protein [uncultured Aquimarina sp.]